MNYEHYYIPIEGGSLIPGILQGSTYLRQTTMLEIPANNTPVSASDKAGKVYTAVISPSGNNQYFMTSGDWDYSSGNLYESQYQWGFYAVMTVDNDLQALGMTLSAGMHNPSNDSWQPYATVYYPANKLDDILDEIRDWDQEPVADGDTTKDNFGGAFADLDPFDYSYIQELDWPDPDLDFLSPYNSDGSPGLFTPYELTGTELANVGKILYDDDIFTAIVQKLDGSSNPISGILRCIQLPLSTNLGAGSYHIAVFGKELYSANVGTASGAHLRGRWVQRSCGYVTLKEVWGTARDYTDVSVSIFLPFVGMRQLDPQLVIGKTLEMRLYVDAYTGDCLYLLKASSSGIGGQWFESSAFIARWAGNCATEIPIGRIDNSRAITSLIGSIGSVAMAGATGGMSLLAGSGSISGLVSNGIQSVGAVSGNVTPNLGIADILYPYIIVQRSVPAYADGWRGKIGATRNGTYTGNDLTGFTLFSQIFLEGMEGASGEEIEALKNELCTEGIIF